MWYGGRFGLCVVLMLTLAGCESFESNDEPTNDLDKELLDVLEEKSASESIAFFQLPDPNDLARIPQDPRNPLTEEKVRLGQLLFHESALSVDVVRRVGAETVACSSCHNASSGFRSGRIQGIGEGGIAFGQRGEGRTINPDYAASEIDVRPFSTLSTLNAAFSSVSTWTGAAGALGANGGTSSRWDVVDDARANILGLPGTETRAINGLRQHRMSSIGESRVAELEEYQDLFASVFPNSVGKDLFSVRNAGLAIAAYMRTLLPDKAPFQRWLRGARSSMTESEKRGALVFFGKANCATCHSGPALASSGFHALGLADQSGEGVFNAPSANDPARLGRGGFTGFAGDNYKFKIPQLYNLMDSPFYGHGGSLRSIREVVEYKNIAIPEKPSIAEQLSAEFVPLNLEQSEIVDLVAFLSTALRDPNLGRYVPDSVPSGSCIPVNDPASIAGLDNCTR